jgi:hypothetical protein
VAPTPGRIDTLKCSEAQGQCVFGCGGPKPSKHKRGGRKPNGRAGYLGGGKGHGSIGSGVRLTVDARVRTLSRSNALKSQALACRKLLQVTWSEPPVPRRANRALRPVSGCDRSLGLDPTPVGAMTELMSKMAVRVARGADGEASGEQEVVRCSRKQGRRYSSSLLERCPSWPKRQESIGRREASLLAEWEKLRRPLPNPKGGCGVKQSHEVQAGSIR